MMLPLIVAVSAGLSLVMVGAWLLQRRTHNAGWVDAVWSFGLGAAGVVYALAPISGSAWPHARQILVAALIGLWSLRLGLYLVGRTGRGPEDSRYAQFRLDWGSGFQNHMFWFLQIQAAAAALLAFSVFLAAHNPRPLGLADLAGLVLLAIAIAGAAVADAQLRNFRRDPAHHGKICADGLWAWSRHPNYFFEWLGWLAYPLFAIDFHGDFPLGWLALSGPLFMYVLLVHVSGIPPLERQMLRSRGDAYRAYQARTRAFLPWPRSD
jgi:steroid 5-alpha reductase family enzyme